MKKRRIATALIILMCLSGCQKNTEAGTIVAEQEVITTEVTTEEPDTTSPVIELASDGVAYYEGDKYDPLSYVVSVIDDSGETIKAEYDDKDVNIASPGDYVISYSATDSAGNISEKKLNFKVKKEYTREEIKEILQELIDNKYYHFEFEDELDLDESEYDEGVLCGAINIYGNFEDNVSDVPIMGIWGNDPNVYTTITVRVETNDGNYGFKNANTTTFNSELLIVVAEHSGETDLCNAESITVSSDSGKLEIKSLYKAGSTVFNKEGYFHDAWTYFCFESEEQIEKFVSIIEANNVNVKFVRENGEDKSFIVRRNQCDNWLKMYHFYEDLNEYINNVPNE